VYCYLTMTAGPRVGAVFLLDLSGETRIGRGVDCNIVLTDPLCSRVHAVLKRANHAWHVVDAQSSNGTYVNNQKIDDAVISDGNQLRLGTTEFVFHSSEQPPTIGDAENVRLTQTLIRNQPISGRDAEAQGLGAIADARQAQELLLLYQLSIRLLSCAEPDEVTRISLELLREWTHATVAGFLWVDDAGHLKPRLVIPQDSAGQVALSESLTEMVFEQGNAIWIASQRPNADTDALKHFADALCMPLVNEGVTLGAIHIYLERGRFRQSHFDFAISLANITAVALARARRETKLSADYNQLVEQSPGHAEMIGQSPPIVELKNKINRLAKASGSVLVRGESGAGKELVARALHRASPRADRPMLSVNCAAIPRELMESQLFGHKAGAFTSADRDHTGYFQQADLGTLFLDEIGELTLEGQAKLLRILEGHPFLPVGASKQVSVDVRVIAATNQDLQKYVRDRKFREDLYYRLSVFELRVPPLRERTGDIELLIDFFLDHFRKLHGRPLLELSASARAKLTGYHWPGNVRQLRNVIDSAVVLADGQQIEPSDLGLRDSGSNELDTLDLQYWERRLIDEALRRTNGNVPDAAQLLGLGRATLYRKLAERQGDRG
jgi:two-component system, NtrC family, response regulator HydG